MQFLGRGELVGDGRAARRSQNQRNAQDAGSM
jgi:hypothetical protein